MVLRVPLMRVQGDLDFMRQGFNHLIRFGQQGAVRGKHWHKALATGHPDKFGQMGMQEWLSHQMEIEELHLPYELAGERVELLRRKEMLGPVRLGAKHAIQVAHIRYFKITSGNHIRCTF